MIQLDIQKLANSRLAVRFGLALGRIIPQSFGYRISSYFANRLAQREDTPMVKAVRANQRMVRGDNITSERLNQAVVDIFTHSGRCYVDLYHNLQNPDGLKRMFPQSAAQTRLITQSRDKKLGAFIVVPHLSNFDLCLLAAAYRGLEAQVMVYGQPTGGYKIHNKIRASTGLDIIRVRPGVHKKVIKEMRNGGSIITAIDRPIRSKTHKMNFFGQLSPLPAGYISMALEAEVPIIVAAIHMDKKGYYRINLSDAVPMVRNDDPDKEIRQNGETVLRIIEGFIHAYPDQWLMYYPVWPS